jgi:cyanoexosortase A
MQLSLKSERFWLGSILVSFIFFYLSLIWKLTGDLDLIVTDLLFWVAILALLYRRRDRLIFNSDPISTFLGLLLIGLVLVKSPTLYWFESNLFVYCAPFVALFGIALIASGIKNLKQYWVELFFSGFLFIPPTFFGFWFNDRISALTAKFSAYLLYYLGFNTTSRGIDIWLNLPDRGNFVAKVDYFCTGILMMGLMLKLALLLVSFFPMKWLQCFWLPLAALAIGFFLGVIRVSILTLAVPDPDRFAFWHGTEGAQIFSTLSIIIFFFFCYPVLKKHNRVNSQTMLTTNLRTDKRETARRF